MNEVRSNVTGTDTEPVLVTNFHIATTTVSCHFTPHSVAAVTMLLRLRAGCSR